MCLHGKIYGIAALILFFDQYLGSSFSLKVSDVSAYGSKYGDWIRGYCWLIVTTEKWTMRKTARSPGAKIVKDIKRATHKPPSSEEKIRIVLDGLHGEDSIAELCRREGITLLDLSRFCFPPSALLSRLSLEGDKALSSQC